MYGDQGMGRTAGSHDRPAASLRRPAAAASTRSSSSTQQQYAQQQHGSQQQRPAVPVAAAAAVPAAGSSTPAAVPRPAAVPASSSSSTTSSSSPVPTAAGTPASSSAARRTAAEPGRPVRRPAGRGYGDRRRRRPLRHARGVPAAASPRAAGRAGARSRSPGRRRTRTGTPGREPEESTPSSRAATTAGDGRRRVTTTTPAASRDAATAAAARPRQEPKKKSRSGCACLVVVARPGGRPRRRRLLRLPVLPGPVRRGRRTTRATARATVAGGDPQGRAAATRSASILKKAGVVKSVDAFVAAQHENPKGKRSRPASTPPRRRCPAESAVTLMLDPKSQNILIIPEGSATSRSTRRSTRSSASRRAPPQDVAKTKCKSLGPARLGGRQQGHQGPAGRIPLPGDAIRSPRARSPRTS